MPSKKTADFAMKYILSISIPTYNRGSILKKTLALLVREEGFDNIQLVISDNHSPDKTAEIVKEFQEKYSNIKYHRNDRNIGLEENIKKVIELSDGEYIKVFNDYTYFEKGKLSTLIQYVQQNITEKPNLFFLNSSSNNDFSVCNSLNSFVDVVSIWSTWISCFGIWKQDYENIKDKESHIGLMFFHTSILFEMILKKKTILYKEKLMASFHIENKGGYHLSVFIEGYFSVLIKKYYERNHITKNTYKKEKKEVLKFLYPYIVGATIKKENNFEKNDLNKILFSYYKKEAYFYFYTVKYIINLVYVKLIANNHHDL